MGLVAAGRAGWEDIASVSGVVQVAVTLVVGRQMGQCDAAGAVAGPCVEWWGVGAVV